MTNSEDHFSTKTGSSSAFPTALKDASVCVWGLGLMGGSLAMALKGKTKALYGIDADSAVCRQALAAQIIDLGSQDPAELLPRADLIVLAAPLGVLPRLIEQLPQFHPSPAIVIDLGSTKANILAAMEHLPERFAPIGGHPMCGKEVRSLANATADLYCGASFALLPLPRTSQAALHLVQQLVAAVGAHPVTMDSETHEKWAASISHLPYLVANSLAGVTPLEAAPLVGPGFASTTRLAVESLDMMMDILVNNGENVLPCLHDFIKQMEQIEHHLLLKEYSALREQFAAGAKRRTEIMDAFRHEEAPQ